jgi:hypothetical protein
MERVQLAATSSVAIGRRLPYKNGRNHVAGRLLVVGVAWITAVFLFAALLQWSGSQPRGIDSSRDGTTALARSLNQLRPAPSADGQTWTVTAATAAHDALVVDVDAIDPGNASHIAARLVEAVGSRYDEILVYVRALDTKHDPVIRRIAWTPRRGYLTSAF